MPPTLDDFAQQILSTGLVELEELRALRAGLPENATAEALGKRLVTDGKLTSYQASMIYQGRGKNLSIGDYVLVDKLGKGGMGVVFRAYHRHMDREVALKVLPSSAVGTKEKVQRFRREVKAAAKLFHQNVVTALDASESRGIHYLVTELVEGPNLTDLVDKRGPLTVPDAIKAIIDAGRGLAYAHDKGIVHRDVKPGNMLIDPDGVVKVLDMGLARFESEVAEEADEKLTVSGMVLGTIDYIAPEQATSTKAADARADIYSLGCTLHYLLIGRAIYKGVTPYQKIRAHVYEPTPKLSELRADVPKSLDAIFERMVAKDPSDRYQSMNEVVAELESCLNATATISLAKDSAATSTIDAVKWLQVVSATAGAPTEEIDSRTDERTQESLRSSDYDSSVDVATSSDSSPLHRRRAGWVLPTVIGSLVIVIGMLATRLIANSRQRDRGETGRVTAAPERSSSVLNESGLAGDPDTVAPVEISLPMADPPIGADIPFEGALGGAPTAFWGRVTTLAYNRRGTIFVASGMDGQVRLGDASKGRWLRSLPVRFSGWHQSAAFSPSEEVVAVADSMSIHLFDSHSGELIRTFNHEGGKAASLAYSPDGRKLAVGQFDGSVTLVSAETGQQLVEPGGGGTARNWQIVFSPDGETLATINSKGVRLRGVNHWKAPVTSFATDSLIGGIAFSPTDSRRLLVGVGPVARWWDVKTRRRLFEWTSDSSFYCVALWPDGQTVVSGDSLGNIRRWEATSGELLWEQNISTAPCVSVAVRPDGREIIAGTGSGSLAILDGDSGRIRVRSGASKREGPEAIHFSPDGRLLGIENMGEDSLLRDLSTKEALHRFKKTGPLQSVAFDPDGRLIAISGRDQSVSLWETDSGTRLQQLRSPFGMEDLCFSPDGRWLAGRTSRLVLLWDVGNSMARRQFDRHRASSLTFTADSTYLLVGSGSGNIHAMDVATSKEEHLLEGHGRPVDRLAVTGSPPMLVSATDGMGSDLIRTWDLSTWKSTGPLGDVHYKPQIAYSPDGRLLAVTVAGRIELWKPTSRVRILSYRVGPSKGDFRSVHFSPDGKRLATLNPNGTVYLFDLAKDPKLDGYIGRERD
ncbi:Serine/threonine-protein kinase PrkC [Planctomycetes bacterium Pan216]|uniref:Serine/threonine-protein kinase PrkC n=1 Tax=Kolteria novifilia TaxID=2527975 RepID=A0A518B9I5_9BACT|nr:Serine/threonine-protein kinase PrkC [Planctomycetes bacterium Pan216]